MTYLGIDVLDLPWHNMREAIAESFARSGTMLDNPTGRGTFDDHAAAPVSVRNFQWTSFDRTGCNALRTFLNARKGRLNPFWIPTYAHDMELAQDVSLSSQTFIFIKSIGYPGRLAATPARKYLAVLPKGLTLQIRKATSSSISSSTVEQIQMDAPTGAQWPASSTVISYLVLCRLADDMTTIRWPRPDQCEASIRFQELPSEVPA